MKYGVLTSPNKMITRKFLSQTSVRVVHLCFYKNNNIESVIPETHLEKLIYYLRRHYIAGVVPLVAAILVCSLSFFGSTEMYIALCRISLVPKGYKPLWCNNYLSHITFT